MQILADGWNTCEGLFLQTWLSLCLYQQYHCCINICSEAHADWLALTKAKITSIPSWAVTGAFAASPGAKKASGKGPPVLANGCKNWNLVNSASEMYGESESALCTWNGFECPDDCVLDLPSRGEQVFFCVEQPASLVCCKGEPSVPGQQNTPQCDLACGTGFWCPTAYESTSLLTEMWEKCRKKGQKTVVCMQKMLFNRLPSVEAESQSDKNQHFLSTVCSLTLSVFCHTLFLSA